MPSKLSGFSDLLLSLYRGCREQPVAGFHDWALGLIKPVLPFDSAFWGSGSYVGEPRVHSAHLHNLSADSLAAWEHHKHKDTLAPRFFAGAGTVFAVPHDELKDMAMYEPFYRPFGILNVLGTYRADPLTGLYDAISYYRADPARPFTEEERLLQSNLVPHLIETCRINRLAHLFPAELPRAQGQRAAACDAMGVLHAAEPTFAERLLDEWPDWRGSLLPAELRALLENREAKYTGRSIVIEISRMHDLFLLRARTKVQADSLSRREREVVGLFAQGRTYKEIARLLSIAPSTVRNHLNTVYTKLQVNNKAEMVVALSGLGLA